MKILKARYRSREAFQKAYQADLPHGGLFCPTTSPMTEGEFAVVEILFPELPNKMMLRGKVMWWRSALPRRRVRAGALVAFLEGDKNTTDFILAIARGEEKPAIKRRHPRIPVSFSINWRLQNAAVARAGELRDISIGGALLVSEETPAVGEEIIIELTTPGAASPMDIAAKVTHQSAEGTGIKFLYRDGGGSVRLREVVRRIINGS